MPVRSADGLLAKFSTCFSFRFKGNSKALNKSDMAHEVFDLVGMLQTNVLSSMASFMNW